MNETCEEMVWWSTRIDLADSARPPFSISHRIAVGFISIISLISCFIDMATSEECICHCRYPVGERICRCRYPVGEHIDSLRQLLLAFFQMANTLLLLAAIVENPWLVQVYVWYALAFVLLGLGVCLAQFLIRVKQAGARWAALTTAPEVAFLFVLFRCLPLVDKYARNLQGL